MQRTYALLVQSDLLCKALLGKVAHRIIVSIGQEMSQMVLSLGVLLHHTKQSKQMLNDTAIVMYAHMHSL